MNGLATALNVFGTQMGQNIKSVGKKKVKAKSKK